MIRVDVGTRSKIQAGILAFVMVLATISFAIPVEAATATEHCDTAVASKYMQLLERRTCD